MAVLVQESVPRTLFSMAVPMLAGTFAMNAYNLTDTWFVSQLGTESNPGPLAAMGFTFPVIMLLTCVARGIGSGMTTLASHAIGRHDHPAAARLVTHGVILTFAVVIVMSVGGYLLIDPIFRRLGAGPDTLPLIGQYMQIWYVGVITMALPMVGGGVLIASGDSKAASKLMIVGTLINLVLDPLLIFGYLGFPEMGIRGAALATVIAQCVSTVWLVRLLARKHRLLVLAEIRLASFLHSLGKIVRFAVPSILSMILMPISATIITWLLSEFGGKEAVAACGAAGRVEMFAFMIPMAVGISLTPFVSQNFGARRLDRLVEAQRVTARFALGYGLFTSVMFFLGAPWLAAAFSKGNERVAEFIVLYIRTVSWGYGMMEVHRYCGFFLTGMHRPISSTILNVIRVGVLLIPLSWLGATTWGIPGVFAGRLATDLVVGTVGLIWVARVLKSASRTIPEEPPAAAPPPLPTAKQAPAVEGVCSE